MGKITSPTNSTQYGHFGHYIDKVNNNDLIQAFQENQAKLNALVKSITAQKLDYKYEADKWTIKEVIGHIIDTERIFGYRALRFARKDDTKLPGFDEVLYGQTTNAGIRNIEDLMEEFNQVRLATISLFKGFDEPMLDFYGQAGNYKINARALGYATVGHCIHHIHLLETKYLI